MDKAFTLREIFTGFVTFCAGIVTISAVVGIVATIVNKIKNPGKKFAEEIGGRMTNAEKRLDEHDKFLANDHKEIKAIEEGERMTQKALFAIMEHLRTGDGKEKLEKAQEALRDYNIDK